jgi:hypothetical protein
MGQTQACARLVKAYAALALGSFYGLLLDGRSRSQSGDGWETSTSMRKSMANQVKHLHHGFTYQHVYSFCELLCLLDAESVYERGRVEDHEAAHADDVTLYPRAGSEAPARFVQVKWHTDLREAYSFDSLCKPSPGAATSLLQKFHKSWQVLRLSGHDLELWLVSTWPADSTLGKHIRGACLSEDFFTGRAKQACAAWATHLNCDDEELRAFARCLRFRLGLSDDVLELLFDSLMRAHGLRRGPQSMQYVDALVRQWVKNGPIEIRAETLRQVIAEHRLAVEHDEDPRLCLWIHGWARHSYAHPPTMQIDWTAYFDRKERRIPTSEDWQATLLPQLADARSFCEGAHAGFVDIRGLLPLSAALAVGAALPTVAGYRLRYEQSIQGQPALWRSDTAPSNLTWHTEVLRQGGPGSDSLVALAISGDMRTDVERLLAASDTEFGRVLIATPATGASDSALRHDADAVALANEGRKLLKRERQNEGARRIHLILYAPAGFALFLGQRLNAIGTIVTYERTQDGGYQPSVILQTT